MTVITSTMLVAGLFAVIYFYNPQEFTDFNSMLVDFNIRSSNSQAEPSNSNLSDKIFWPNCERNQSAANVTNFNSLPEIIKNFLYIRHCRHFPMLLDIPDKCGGPDRSADVFLLLVIKTLAVNYDRRELLRKTWAEERKHNDVWIRRLFIAGTAHSGSERERMNQLLEIEHRKYNDILQWDFDDTFYNLTLKQMLFLEWMGRNCPHARFLMNGDDDVLANTDNMVVYLQNLKDNDGSKHLFTGHLIPYVGPIRNPHSKYFVPVQLYEPNLYPPYCGGGGFILSGYTASVIYNMSHSITFIPIDDVYMGMCLAKAKLLPSHHLGVRTAGLDIPSIDSYDPCYYKEMLLVHRFLSGNLYFMWHKLHDPNLNCSTSTQM